MSISCCNKAKSDPFTAHLDDVLGSGAVFQSYNLIGGKNSSQWKPIVTRDSSVEKQKKQHSQKARHHTAYVVWSKSTFMIALARVAT